MQATTLVSLNFPSIKLPKLKSRLQARQTRVSQDGKVGPLSEIIINLLYLVSTPSRVDLKKTTTSEP
jgi:hypothetical protein